MTWRLRGWIGGSAAALLVLQIAGCGRAAPTSGPAPRQEVQAARAATDPDAVNAVSTANSTTPISVKFRIDHKPQVGEPLSIVLALIPIRRGERWAIWTSAAILATLFVVRLTTDPRCLVVLDPLAVLAVALYQR